MRKASITLTSAIALLMLGALGAWACTNLATLNLASSAGQAGERLELTGSSFRTAERDGQDVQIRWDTVDGTVLATATPDDAGAITASVRIPSDAQPGYHVLVATQETIDSDGVVETAYGTPARASFLVGGELPADVGSAPVAATPAAADAGNGGLIALTILLAIAGIGLFGSGLGLFVREVRQRDAKTAPVEKD